MSGRLRNRLLVLLLKKQMEEGRTITQLELAHETGVTPHTINRWFHNDVTRFDAPMIEALCAYFKCEVGDLLVIEQTETSQSEK